MSNVSEEMSQMSINLLLKALESLSLMAIDGGKLLSEINKDGSTSLLGLINKLRSQNYDLATQRALDKLSEACEKPGVEPIKMAISTEDVPELKKWLKKQDVLFAACTPKKSAQQTLDETAEKGKQPRVSTVYCLQSDAEKLENAVAIIAYQKKLKNTLPPEAFFLLHNKKDISVVDGLNYDELNVFRELAQKQGLGYTEMQNGETYKVVCGKENSDKLKAVMRMVSWTMSGVHADSVREKVKERLSLKEELEMLITKGVKAGSKTFTDESGKHVTVENAKFVVNSKDPNQYVKITAKGFYQNKFGKEDFVSISDLDYEEKLREALSEYPDAVVIDAVEWEKLGLDKQNLRQNKVTELVSVFPPEFDLEKEEMKMRKVQKKRVRDLEPLDETAWLFHKYDPEGDVHLSEVVEVNYNDPSQPLERTVTDCFNSSLERSRKYKYYDVETDEKSVDHVILEAKERSLGNTDYAKETKEKEEDL